MSVFLGEKWRRKAPPFFTSPFIPFNAVTFPKVQRTPLEDAFGTNDRREQDISRSKMKIIIKRRDETYLADKLESPL
jgi:hypothetical protein